MYSNAKTYVITVKVTTEGPVLISHFALCSQEELGCDQGLKVWVATDRQVQLVLRALQPFKKGNFHLSVVWVLLTSNQQVWTENFPLKVV